MSELLTKEEWSTKYGEFCQRHTWLIYQKSIECGPGWLEIVDQCLSDLEDMLRLVGIENITFSGLYVRDGRDKSLSIYAEFNPLIGSALIALCNDRIQDTILISTDVCRKCGGLINDDEVHFGRRKNSVCEAHAKFEGVFKEDFDEWQSSSLKEIAEQAKIEANEEEFGCENKDEGITEIPIAESEIEEPVILKPSAKLYDLEELNELKTDKSNDRHVNQKRKETVKQMKKLGERRLFCDVPDAIQMAQTLKLLFPNFVEVIEFIEAYVKLANRTGKLRLPPILLEGPAGIGKTVFATNLAKLLNTKYIEVHMENEQSNSRLAGSSEFWGNSQWGDIFEGLVFGMTINPLVVIDEVDKASTRTDYNPLSPLYQLLERDTAKQFRDSGFSSVSIDASYVMWILTANNSSMIDPPILSRMRRFDIKPPTLDQAESIAKRIYTNVLERNEWIEFFDEELSKEVARKLAEFSPRLIQAEIEAALGRAAKAGRKTVLLGDVSAIDHSPKRGMGFIWPESNDE